MLNFSPLNELLFLKDTFRHQGLRQQLVDLIRAKGIKDERVLEAINKVPRHLFMDSGFLEHAYQDKAFPIAADQTISQPYTVAFQTELLQIKTGDKVLEIGTGSGYQAAVLSNQGVVVKTFNHNKKSQKRRGAALVEYGLIRQIVLQHLPDQPPVFQYVIRVVQLVTLQKRPTDGQRRAFCARLASGDSCFASSATCRANSTP